MRTAGVVVSVSLLAFEAQAGPLVLASRSVALEEAASVLGDVGVRGDVTGPTLVSGQRLAVGKGGKVSPQGFSCADTILLASGAIAGALDVTTLTDLGAQHGSVSPIIPLPELPAHAPFEIFVGADVTVPAHGVVDLHPSGIALGDVLVGASGTLRVFGGAYDARRLRLGPRARVELQSDVVFHLATDLRTDVHATIEGAAGATVDTDAALIVEGIDAGGEPSVRIGPFNAISASLRVVADHHRIEYDTVVGGELVGRDVSIGRGVSVSRPTYGTVTCPAVCFTLNCPAVCFSHAAVPKPTPLPASCVTVKSVQQIRASQSTWNVIFPHFVESNRIGYPGDDAFSDAVMLSFVEVSQDNESKMAARYNVSIGDAWSGKRTFPSAGFTKGEWTYTPPDLWGTFLGDYAYGTFSTRQLGVGWWASSFTSVWPQTDPIAGGKYSMDIHTNSVVITP